MESTSCVTPGAQRSQSFPLRPEMSRGSNILSSNKLWTSSVNQDIQGSTSFSFPPSPQGLQCFQNPLSSQDTPTDPRRQQKKRTVFTQEQKQVLEEHYNKCTKLSQEQCMVLSQRLGLTKDNIRIWFKNRRGRENRKKAQGLRLKLGSGSHVGAALPEGCIPQHTSASANSHSQSQECYPKLIPNSSSLDQSPRDVCFRKSPAREQRLRQSANELSVRRDHQSPGRSGLHEDYDPGSRLTSSEDVHEGPLDVSHSAVLSPLNMTPQSESTYTTHQRPQVVSSLPQLQPFSNFLDQKAILPQTDQGYEDINEQCKRFWEQSKLQKKARELSWKGGHYSIANSSSSSASVDPMDCDGEDSLSLGQSGFSPPLQVNPSALSPDSEFNDSMSQDPSWVSSAPPLSPSIFVEPESVSYISQINEFILSEAQNCSQDGQVQAEGGRISCQSVNCLSSAQPESAQALDPVHSPLYCPDSAEAPEADTKDDGRVKVTPPVSSISATEKDQCSTAMKDQLFLDQLAELDAALDQFSQQHCMYFMEHFSLLDFF